MQAVLFDLGNTLIEYFQHHEFPAILRRAISTVQSFLRDEGLLTVDDDATWRRVAAEDHESPDYAVRTLEARLTRIFQHADPTPTILNVMCQSFLHPIFAKGRVFDDATPVLEVLRCRGVQTGIVSNTPWGSPASLWREEIHRLSIDGHVDAAVFCRDVGWRKPARRIFEYALAKLHVNPPDCVFVGDDPRWDLVGPRSIGMSALLLDRHATTRDPNVIRDLSELLEGVSQFPCETCRDMIF
jgi:putative hydrolase of the HAD superfamily